MDSADDGTRTAAGLAAALRQVTFTGLAERQVTGLLTEAIAAWGRRWGWRLYLRAPSVFPLPAPLTGTSVVDVGFARADGPPVVCEIDRTDRQRTVDKLLAEAAAGRVAIWVRWGAGPFAPPPLPVHLVTLGAARRDGRWSTVADLPAPRHSGAVAADEVELPWEGLS